MRQIQNNRRFLRYLLIEGVLFFVIWGISQMIQMPYAFALILCGVIVTTMPFMAGYSPVSGYGVYRDSALRNEINQMQERAKNRSSMTLINGYVLYGLPLLIVGFVLSFWL